MENTAESTTASTWEFLGRNAAEIGVHSETLEKRLGGLDPEQAAGIVNGYMDSLTERNPTAAYSFLSADWAKMLIRNRKSRTAAIVKGIASQETQRAPDAEDDRDLLNLITAHLKDDETELGAIAEAAENTRPRISAAIYSSRNDTTRLTALAEKVFQTDRSLAFALIPNEYHNIRQSMAAKTLDCADFSRDDAGYALENLPCPGLGADTAQYETFVTKAMEVEPFVALRAAEKLKEKRHGDAASVELHKKARTNLIKKEGVSRTYDVRRCFVTTEERCSITGFGHSSRVDVVTDREGALELALKLNSAGQGVDCSLSHLRGAIELFRLLEYKGQERTEAVRALNHAQKIKHVYGDNKFNFSPAEEVAAGLSLAETSPTEAYFLLAGHIERHAEAREAMHPLSIALEVAGDIENAYSAERKAETPDTARVDELRTTLAQQSNDRCPHEFYWHKDTEGRKIWFGMHGQDMKLGDRYRFAFELSRDTGDESHVQPLRDEAMSRGMYFARHHFHYAGDTKGMDMLKQKLLQEQPALAEHTEFMTTLLDLVVKEERE